eukprot:886624-Amphidinium_carterae.1
MDAILHTNLCAYHVTSAGGDIGCRMDDTSASPFQPRMACSRCLQTSLYRPHRWQQSAFIWKRLCAVDDSNLAASVVCVLNTGGHMSCAP